MNELKLSDNAKDCIRRMRRGTILEVVNRRNYLNDNYQQLKRDFVKELLTAGIIDKKPNMYILSELGKTIDLT